MPIKIFRSLAIAVASLNAIALCPSLAIAQHRQQLQVTTTRLDAGTVLSVAPPSVGATQYFSHDTIHPVSLSVTKDVFDSFGNVAIPAGSTLRGELRPVTGGSRFFGSLLVTEQRAYSLQAVSPLIHDEKDPRQYEGGAIAEDALIGAAAGALLGVVTGGVSTLGVIGGAAAGVGVGNVSANRAIVLRPEQPIVVSLDTPITIINEPN